MPDIRLPAKSRSPEKGELVGGPRGALLKCDADETGFCVGDGGGIWRCEKELDGGGALCDPGRWSGCRPCASDPA